MWHPFSARFVIALTALLLLAVDSHASELESTLSALRDKHHFPAIGAAVIHADGTIEVAVVGVRKAGSDVAATAEDQFHLGSCTKAMTATLIARLVDQGKLRWETTIAEGLPELADSMLPEYRDVTILQLLSHWAGLPPSDRSWPQGMNIGEVRKLASDPRQQRHQYLRHMLAQAPVAKPGSRFEYSNAGYTVAAAIAERVLDQSWEDAMRSLVFEPLEMKTAGFGPMGIEGNQAGRIDQPWQHVWDGNKHTPIEPVDAADNPPAIWPGGGVHCSLGDWAKFVRVHLLDGIADVPVSNSQQPFLSETSLQTLHRPTNRGTYALGWGARQDKRAGGLLLTHAGSNTMNYCLAWLAPGKKTAILVATNQAGGDTEEAVAETVHALAKAYVKE